MKVRTKNPKLQKFFWFWVMHFGFHLLMAMLAFGAGLFIAITEGEFIPGLALCGAAAFAFINGVNGFRELIGKKEQGDYLNDN